MKLFRKTQKKPIVGYDPAQFIPVIRCSICTGEQTAGFRDKDTRKFHEVMLIRNEQDLEEFRALYGLGEIKKEY